MITGLNHVSIVVPDIEAAARQLSEKYGLARRPAHGERRARRPPRLCRARRRQDRADRAVAAGFPGRQIPRTQSEAAAFITSASASTTSTPRSAAWRRMACGSWAAASRSTMSPASASRSSIPAIFSARWSSWRSILAEGLVKEIAAVKIKRVEPIAVSFPMKKPVFMAGVEIRQADNVLVRVEADNAVVGWGEAASAPTMTGETVESMMAAVAYLAAAVEGRPAEDIAGDRRGDGHADVRQQCRQGGDRDGVARSGRPRDRPARPMRCSAASRGAAWPFWASSAPASSPPTCARPSARRRTAIARSRSRSASTSRWSMPNGRGGSARFSDARLLISVRCQPGLERRRRRCNMCARWPACGLDFFEQPVHADDIDGMAAVAARRREYRDRRRREHPFARGHPPPPRQRRRAG